VLTGSARDQWAKSGSANPDIKVYIGALAGQDGSGYVDPNTLASYITHAQRTWSSFGGVMLWEASLAVGMTYNLFFYRASSAC
jgi:chitinase